MNEGHGTNLLELPQDTLNLIFPCPPPKSFLALCSVNKEAYERYHHDPPYSRIKTSETFRLLISPLLYDSHRKGGGTPTVLKCKDDGGECFWKR
jgi:hypothetical protein